MNSTPTFAEIKTLVSNLSIQEQIEILEELEQKLETLFFMKLAETGFQEWNDPEEYIYHVES
jgi:hypothetical protein